MRAEYKRDVSHNYLILQEEKAVDTSSYQVRMLTGNVIPSILKCHLQNLDGEVLFYYDITSKQSIATLFEDKKFRSQDIQRICKSNGRAGRIPDEYGSACASAGIHLYGCREEKSVFLLPSRISKRNSGAASGIDRIYSAKA